MGNWQLSWYSAADLVNRMVFLLGMRLVYSHPNSRHRYIPGAMAGTSACAGATAAPRWRLRRRYGLALALGFGLGLAARLRLVLGLAWGLLLGLGLGLALGLGPIPSPRWALWLTRVLALVLGQVLG